MKTILSGNVLWSFDYEIQNREKNQDLAFQFSFIKPFHKHSGIITLDAKSLQIKGDDNLILSLSNLVQLYLGFDDNFTPILSKNLGLFWQPLRLTTQENQHIYLIIDYNFFTTNNKIWFQKLQEVLQ